MGEVLSSNQIREKYKAAMPEHVGDRFNSLFHSVAWLNLKWIDYRSLFADRRETIDLLNAISGSLFYDLERLHWESLLLHLCRLTDRNRGTLSLISLEKLIPKIESPEFLQAVRETVEKSCVATKFARIYRDKFLAHFEMPRPEGKAATQQLAAREDSIKVAIDAIAEAMNCVEEHYLGGKVEYGEALESSLGVHSLLHYLRKGLEAQREEDANRIRRAGG